MTAQIPNKLFYNGEQYSIIGGAGSIDFKPQDFGLSPSMVSTACWSGYWCDYEISDGWLFLKNLYIYTDGDYPPFNGVEVAEQEYTEATVIRGSETSVEMVPKYSGARVYKDVKLLVDVEGTLTIGSGFNDRFYRHMGYQEAWTFDSVYDLRFERARLVEEVDRSAWAAAQRETRDLCDPYYAAETANRLLDGIDECLGLTDETTDPTVLEELAAAAERVARGLKLACDEEGLFSDPPLFSEDVDGWRAEKEARAAGLESVRARAEKTLQRIAQMRE